MWGSYALPLQLWKTFSDRLDAIRYADGLHRDGFIVRVERRAVPAPMSNMEAAVVAAVAMGGVTEENLRAAIKSQNGEAS